MAESTSILVAAINARHSHASLGARCLLANLGELREQADLAEFTIQQSAAEIAATIAARKPRILGLGVYIWNAARVAELLPLLRHKLPDMKIVLGGPEILESTSPDGSESRPYLSHPVNPVNPVKTSFLDLADFLIFGEGDLAFAALCREILSSHDPCSSVSIRGCLDSPPPDLSTLQLPYAEYTDADLAHRLLYVESSRGCAMRCDYCVSANDEAVRFFPMPALLAAFDRLLARGARQFKFCDRSFNLDVPRALEILAFFRERQPLFPGLFLHFEMLPDRFPAELRAALAAFPPRSLQLEIGLQSFNPQVLETIRRLQNLDRAADNLRFLREQTRAFLHTDLIAGLPGETPESFAAGFDRLFALGPHEIQLGILKKLPGAPIARHDDAFAMRYDPAPPYEVRATRDWPADHLARTARCAHWWDAIVDSQRFIPAAPLIWRSAPSVFGAFMELSDWLGARFPREHGVPLADLVAALFDYLTQIRGFAPATVADALLRGYRHTGARDMPAALAPHVARDLPPPTSGLPKSLRRQFLRWTWDAANPKLSSE
ncbi:MAG TPA: B12-binding domain-containing radical SAM protein [Kiritimatiellia bacterium]|nr:B12-binding domain-containing radical SAM protein [Kiritimatiellia bacterium]